MKYEMYQVLSFLIYLRGMSYNFFRSHTQCNLYKWFMYWKYVRYM